MVIFEVLKMDERGERVVRRIQVKESEANETELKLYKQYDGDEYYIRDNRG
jgi:hypothetical protein